MKVSGEPLSELRAIETLLHDSTRRIIVEEQVLLKLVVLKSGLMSDLLTGRVRVPENLDLTEVRR